MALELHEGLDNAGDLLKGIAAAVHPSSEGGKQIKQAELIGIISDFVMKLGIDIVDDD